MTGKLSINVNERVSVELTAKGLEVLARHFKDYPELLKKDLVGLTYETQLWQLLEIFGPMTSLGCTPCFQHLVVDVAVTC